MKTSLLSQDGLKRKLEFTVPEENVKASFSKNFEKYQKEADIPGFRKGKAPKDKVKASYQGKIWNSVIDHLFSDFYPKVLSEHKLNPAGQPRLLDVKLEEEKPCTFTIELEIHPKIQIKKYLKLKIQKKEIKVTDEEVDSTLKKLQDSFATYKDKEKKEKIPAEINDEFLGRFQVKTLDELKEKIKKDLKELNEQKTKESIENEVIAKLVEENPTSLPESLIAEQKETLKKNAKKRLDEYGVKDQEQIEWLNQREKEFEKEARFNVHSGYLIETLIKDLKIKPSEKDIEESLKESFPSKTADEMRQELQKHRYWNYFIFNLTRKKVVDYLVKEADIS